MHPTTSTCQYGEGEDGGLRWPAARAALQDSDGAAELGPPSAGWAKLNTYDSFVAATGAAGGGMILRDDRGDMKSYIKIIYVFDEVLAIIAHAEKSAHVRVRWRRSSRRVEKA